MSISIPTGFRIDGTDMAVMHRRVTKFRGRLAAIAAEEHCALISKIACSLIDRSYAYGRKWSSSPYFEAWAQVSRERKSLADGSHRNPLYDFGLTLYLVPDGRTSSTYGIVASDRKGWNETWLSQAYVEPHAYWDNADRDDDIPASQWRRRKATWQRLIPPGNLRDHCIVVEMAHEILVPTVDDVVRLQPAEHARRTDAARERLVADALVGVPKDDAIRTAMRAMNDLNEPEGMEKLRAAAEAVRIPAWIDRETMTAYEMPPLS